MFKEIANTILEYMYSVGLWGIYGGIVIESVFTVIPSALILGYAGYMVFLGEWNLWIASLVASLGNLSGALILYYLGYRFGDQVIIKVGSIIGIDKTEYERLKKMFAKFGEEAVIIAQVIPGIRSMISVYAGVIKLKLSSLLLQTSIGGFIWCSLVIYVASLLGEGWARIDSYISVVKYIVLVLFFVGMGYFLYKEVYAKR